MNTKILPCTCKNEWQDKKYGNGNRVFNQVSTPPTMPKAWRCTVCTAKKVS